MIFLVMLKRIMISRNEVHFAFKYLLNLIQNLVGLFKLLGFVMCLAVMITVCCIATDEDQVKLDIVFLMPLLEFLCIRET